MNEIQALVAQFMFASLRYLPVIAIPALSPLSWAPGMVRIAVLFCWPGSPCSPRRQDVSGNLATTGRVVIGVRQRIAAGLTFALAVMLPQAALGMSAAVADLQAGLSAATLFNPAARTSSKR